MQMSILVEQQDETINTIEQQAFNVQKDTEAGYVVTICLTRGWLLSVIMVPGCNTRRRQSTRPGRLGKSDGFASSLSLLSLSQSSVVWRAKSLQTTLQRTTTTTTIRFNVSADRRLRCDVGLTDLVPETAPSFSRLL
jgi:hypothetical protein